MSDAFGHLLIEASQFASIYSKKIHTTLFQDMLFFLNLMEIFS